MDLYVQWVSAHPLFSAAIQFAVLGTFGELLSFWIKNKSFSLPCSLLQLALKVLAWALLGVVIKYGFAGMKGFTRALLEHEMLPAFMAAGLGWAIALSCLTNIFFGPQMMLLHRVEDNLILLEWNFAGLKKAWWTLIWFWIPAHTLTFLLPKEYQIGLAALWSVMLGLIMGLSSRR
jgi:hypothetical protein